MPRAHTSSGSGAGGHCRATRAASLAVVIVVAALLSGGARAPGAQAGARAGGGPGSAAAARARAGAVPDVRLDAVIRSDQLVLVGRTADLAVGAALGRLDSATRRLSGDQGALAADRHAGAHAGWVEAAARAVLGRDLSALGADTAADRRARADVGGDRLRLQALAIGWYTGGASVDPSIPAPLSAAQDAGKAGAELSLLTSLTDGALRQDAARAQATGLRVRAATRTVGEDHVALVADVDDAVHAAAVVSAASRVVGVDRSAVTAAVRALQARRATRAMVLAAFERVGGRGRHPVPSILGPSAMTGPQMAAWFTARGGAVATKATVGQLTSWYLAEGRAEGVRGDVAFAQAVVETGSFDSPDAVERNNYAGVGHCDHCRAGWRFASPLAGVRGQIQLLRTYADATLTSADLPSPPPLAALAPQHQSVRGCCRTWNSLTGVWATDPAYGSVVLRIYAEMLAYAVADPSATPTVG